MPLAQADEIRDRQRKHWNSVAGGWDRWFAWTERNFEPLTGWFHEAAGWVPGTRVLDVACGAGYPALAAARAVEPGGRVVASDLAPDMLAVASARAKAEGVDTIAFVEMDAGALRVADGSFDAVTNAYGLMFCPDPARAIGEAYRVLAPRGRLAVATWADPAMSPFFTIVRGVAARFLGLQAPAANEPHPFRLASADALRTMFAAAGFADVRADSLTMTFDCDSALEYYRMFTDLAWRARVAQLTPDEDARFQQAIAEAVAPHMVGGRLRLAAASICASGRK